MYKGRNGVRLDYTGDTSRAQSCKVRRFCSGIAHNKAYVEFVRNKHLDINILLCGTIKCAGV